MADNDANETPKRGLTAVIRDEIGVKTHVQLGFVIVVCGSLLGGILWLTAIKADAATALRGLEEVKAQRREDKDDIRREMERINRKLDELLARKQP